MSFSIEHIPLGITSNFPQLFFSNSKGTKKKDRRTIYLDLNQIQLMVLECQMLFFFLVTTSNERVYGSCLGK